MAISSGNSNSSLSSSLLQNSGSEEDLVLMDQRKRKRMQSNRESARRSRMRKQKHLDDLTVQISHIGQDNNEILTRINLTTQQFLNIEAENSILTAQMLELSQRLDSLNEILHFIGNNNNTSNINGIDHHHDYTTSFINNPSTNATMFYQSQHPIMASADHAFQYC